MKTDPASDLQDELRPEYDTEFVKRLLKNGVRGKHVGKITKINGRPVAPSHSEESITP